LVAVDDTVFGVSYYNGIWKFTGSGLIGIDPIQFDEMSVELYPNPSTNQITIGNNTMDECELRVFDASGKLIEVQKEYQPGSNLNISNLSTGSYFIWMHGNGYQKALKFVKE